MMTITLAAKRLSAILGCFTILSFFSPAQAETILIFGDSLSAAYGMPEQKGWVHLLQKELPEHHIVNASVSGETTIGGLQRLPAVLKRYRPGLVFLELGANDGLRGLSLPTMKDNLTAMTKLIREQKNGQNSSPPKILLAGMKIPPNYGKRYTQSFEHIYTELAQEHSLALIPFFLEGVAGHPQLIQTDGLHPNERAQEKLMRIVLMHLKALL
jgi:acyl-CoA thioesterase-1